MWEYASAFATEIFGDLFDPRKRVFVGYLASAWAIAFLWLLLRRGAGVRRALGGFFSRDSWLTRSAVADYAVFLVNGILMLALAPALLTQLTVAFVLFEWMHGWFGGRPAVDASPAMIMVAFTVTLFLVDDVARYAVHRLLHRVRFLWAFHRVHHSATSLNPLTVFRTHPVEGIIFSVRGALVQGACIAPFIFFFGDRVELFTILGASAFTFAFNALGSNLRHSHVAIGYWPWLERVVMSPAQHQVHHSTAERHVDRNFGATLSLWDWIFGTHCHSNADEALTFGVRGEDPARAHGLVGLYGRPFADAARSIAAAVRRVAVRGRAIGHRVGEIATRFPSPPLFSRMPRSPSWGGGIGRSTRNRQLDPAN